MKRSADLLTAIEAGEKQVLDILADSPISEAKTRALLQELVRNAVAAMLARQESNDPVHDLEHHLTRITADVDHVKQAQRKRDWSVASAFALDVAKRSGLSKDEVETPAITRQILSTMRRLLDLAERVEKDFEDPLHAARDLLQDHNIAPSREALKPPIRLSAAIEKACEESTRDVEVKIRTVGRVALVFLGDIPVSSLTLDQSYDFLHVLWSLPKNWGKAHGKNRFGQEGKPLDPVEEMRTADALDRTPVEAVLADESLSRPDKRQRLVADLTPRLTDGYLIVQQRDMFQRIIKAALGAKRVGRDIMTRTA